ncbi:MAG TPA: HAD family hydrolase [Thermoplasmata archaeon]|nr:HAD family hydrolase [Thermoplasmata archaeon]
MVVKVVAFDMDGVLVEGQSSWVTVHFALGTDNEAGYRAYTAGLIDDHQFMRSDIALWLERGVDHIDDVRRILDRVPLFPGAAQTVRTLREWGFRTVIVSGGLDLLAGRIGRELGIDVVLANGLETFEDGHLTGRGILRVPLLNKRAPLAVTVSRMGDDVRLVSIGDSAVDIAMFMISDLSIAFNPRDRVVSEGATRTVFSGDLTAVLEYIAPDVPAGNTDGWILDDMTATEIFRDHRGTPNDP